MTHLNNLSGSALATLRRDQPEREREERREEEEEEEEGGRFKDTKFLLLPSVPHRFLGAASH